MSASDRPVTSAAHARVPEHPLHRPPAVGALVGVRADEHAARDGGDEHEGLDRDDEREGDGDDDRHADAHVPREDGALVHEAWRRGARGGPGSGGSRCRDGRSRTDRHRLTASAERPGYRAVLPSSSSMRRSRLYLATRSERRRGAGLDLAGVRGHREVGDRRVLGLAGAVADDRRPAVARRQADAYRASRSACRSGSA